MNCVRLRELEVLSYFPQEINKRVILIKLDCDSILCSMTSSAYPLCFPLDYTKIVIPHSSISSLLPLVTDKQTSHG